MSTESTSAMKYAERLKNSEKVEEAKIGFQVKKAQKALESQIIDFEEELANLEIELNEVTSAFPFNVKKAIDAEDKKQLVERKLSQAQRMLKELF
jgi:esterase/lipase